MKKIISVLLLSVIIIAGAHAQNKVAVKNVDNVEQVQNAEDIKISAKPVVNKTLEKEVLESKLDGKKVQLKKCTKSSKKCCKSKKEVSNNVNAKTHCVNSDKACCKNGVCTKTGEACCMTSATSKTNCTYSEKKYTNKSKASSSSLVPNKSQKVAVQEK